jgi:hypothetical protein
MAKSQPTKGGAKGGTRVSETFLRASPGTTLRTSIVGCTDTRTDARLLAGVGAENLRVAASTTSLRHVHCVRLSAATYIGCGKKD